MRASSSDTVICVPLVQAASMAAQVRTILVFIGSPLGLDGAESTHWDRTLHLTHSGDSAGPCYARRTLATLGGSRTHAPTLRTASCLAGRRSRRRLDGAARGPRSRPVGLLLGEQARDALLAAGADRRVERGATARRLASQASGSGDPDRKSVV